MKALQKQVGGKHYRGFVIQPVDIGDKAERENATATSLWFLHAVEAGQDSETPSDSKLPGQDSNLDKENQNLLCYRYTTG